MFENIIEAFCHMIMLNVLKVGQIIMKLSMFTIMDWLMNRGYTISYNIKEGSPILSGIRLKQEEKSINEILHIYLSDSIVDNSYKTIVTNNIDSIFLKEDCIASIHDEISNAFSYYNDWEKDLLFALVNGENLNVLLEIAHNVFKRPMFIKGDSSWAYAVTPGYDNSVHPDWEKIEKSIHERTADFDSVRTVSLDPNFQLAFAKKYPVILKSPFYGGNVLRTNVWVDEQRVCEIIVIENEKPFNQGEIHLLYMFSQIVEKYIMKNRADFLTLSDISIFFIEMIESNSVVASKFPLIRNAFNWGAEEILAVLCVKVHTQCETPILGVLRDTLSKQLKCSCVFSYHSHIVSIIAIEKNGGYPSLVKQLKKLILPEAFTWGISYEFNSIEKTAEFYKQALMVLKVSDEMKIPGATMYEVACQCIISEITKISDLQTLVHPALRKLEKSDLVNGTHYFTTLYQFLLFGGNYTNTANYLNLHRNSLIYRISRIQEIIDINLDNLDNVKLLLLSYFIMGQS